MDLKCQCSNGTFPVLCLHSDFPQEQNCYLLVSNQHIAPSKLSSLALTFTLTSMAGHNCQEVSLSCRTLRPPPPPPVYAQQYAAGELNAVLYLDGATLHWVHDFPTRSPRYRPDLMTPQPPIGLLPIRVPFPSVLLS
jgi:hypothetical protein